MTLRRLRIGISFIIFTLFLWLFLWGIESNAPNYSQILLGLQFVPALIKVLTFSFGFAFLGFLIIIITSFIFGRFYCAAVCPLGILQDIVIFFSHRLKLTRHHQYQRPFKVIRYTVLLLSVLITITGSITMVSLLDPYSIFGRIVTHLLKPILIGLNNLIVPILESFNVYAITYSSIHSLTIFTLSITLILFFLVVGLALFKGRQYCNTICPVGTVLGLLAKKSLFSIQIDQQQCNACGLCERACRAGCIDSRFKQVDHDRCVVCFDCLETCQKIHYVPKLKDTIDQKYSLSRRREFLKRTTLLSAAMLLPSANYGQSPEKEGEKHPLPIIPPGAKSIENYIKLCTACHLCVSACPSKVLTPLVAAFGRKGIMQPGFDLDQGYCQYSCNTCSRICPTGAISPITLEEKQLIQVGKVKLFIDTCVVEKERQDCGACAEVCPTHAVYIEKKNNLYYPKIDEKPCIGCGACQHVCPTFPKSIIVERNTTHATAEKPFYNQPTPKKEPEPAETEQEFPF